MNHETRQHKPVFGADGALIGYIDDSSGSGSVIAYDASFNLVGAAGTVTGAKKLIVHTSYERSQARSRWQRSQ